MTVLLVGLMILGAAGAAMAVILLYGEKDIHR